MDYYILGKLISKPTSSQIYIPLSVVECIGGSDNIASNSLYPDPKQNTILQLQNAGAKSSAIFLMQGKDEQWGVVALEKNYSKINVYHGVDGVLLERGFTKDLCYRIQRLLGWSSTSVDLSDKSFQIKSHFYKVSIQ
jgi:hypothetical protein